MIDPQFIVSLRGKDYPLYAGVLDAATKAGLKALTTKVIQIPSAENGMLAVVMATAVFDDGRVFEDVGDCSPQSTAPHLAAAALRLASTRAKGRVLRDSINVGQTLFEELPDGLGDEKTKRKEYREPDARPSDPPRGGPPVTANEGTQRNCRDCSADMPPGMVRTSISLYGAPYCMTCRKNHPPLAQQG